MRHSESYLLILFILASASVGGFTAGASAQIEIAELPQPVHVRTVAEVLVEASTEAGLPAHAILNQAWIESRLTDPPVGEYLGPMQVSIREAMREGYDPIALLDWRNSSRVGVEWFARWVRKCGADNASRAYMRGRCE